MIERPGWAGGVSGADFDLDGDLDLYVVSGSSEFKENDPVLRDRLYLNDGGGGFEDATQASGLGDARYACGVCAGDFDNAGDLDLYLTHLREQTNQKVPNSWMIFGNFRIGSSLDALSWVGLTTKTWEKNYARVISCLGSLMADKKPANVSGVSQIVGKVPRLAS